MDAPIRAYPLAHTSNLVPRSLVALAHWNALERAIDRWASIGAFALALLAAVTFLIFF